MYFVTENPCNIITKPQKKITVRKGASTKGGKDTKSNLKMCIFLFFFFFAKTEYGPQTTNDYGCVLSSKTLQGEGVKQIRTKWRNSAKANKNKRQRTAGSKANRKRPVGADGMAGVEKKIKGYFRVKIWDNPLTRSRQRTAANGEGGRWSNQRTHLLSQGKLRPAGKLWMFLAARKANPFVFLFFFGWNKGNIKPCKLENIVSGRKQEGRAN